VPCTNRRHRQRDVFNFWLIQILLNNSLNTSEILRGEYIALWDILSVDIVV
jgi:hypothetical protein